MRIVDIEVEQQITQALRKNFSRTAQLLIQRIEPEALAKILRKIRWMNEEVDPSKSVLKLAVRHLTFDQKLYFLKKGSSTDGMDAMIMPIMQDPQIQVEIKNTFSHANVDRRISYDKFERPEFIFDPVFIQAIALHLTIENNIFNRGRLSITIWDSFSDPINMFRYLVRGSFIKLDFERLPLSLILQDIGHHIFLSYHGEFHYREMIRLRLEARKHFSEAYLSIEEDLVNLLKDNISKDDFELYAIALQNLVTIGAPKEEVGYTTPIYLDPKYCLKYNYTTFFGEDPDLIITLQAYQQIPKDHPVKLLIVDWFNHEVTPSQLAYAKKLSEGFKLLDRQPLFKDRDLNRLIQQIVDNLIIQQELEYAPINKVSKQVGETITSLFPEQVKFPESLSRLIGFFSEGEKMATKEQKKEGVPKSPAIKQTVDKEDAPKQDGVFIEMDEKSKTEAQEQKEEKVLGQTIIENEKITPPNYTEKAVQFIFDIMQYLEDTKGFLLSMLFGESRQFLLPITKIIPLFTKNIKNFETNSQPKLYALQLCLALLINPEAQKFVVIANLINDFYQELAGDRLAPIMKMDSKADKELQAALRQDVIDNIKMILTQRNLSCEDLSMVNIVSDIEKSLNKKPAEEKATSEGQLSL